MRVRIRIQLAKGPPFGPGKIDILEAVRDTGSIAAAGRHLGMSYKRAWTLVDALNATFRTPLVERSTGGKAGGGATLTALGIEVVARYRRVEAAALRAATAELGTLEPQLAPPRRDRRVAVKAG